MYLSQTLGCLESDKVDEPNFVSDKRDSLFCLSLGLVVIERAALCACVCYCPRAHDLSGPFSSFVYNLSGGASRDCCLAGNSSSEKHLLSESEIIASKAGHRGGRPAKNKIWS